MKTRIDKVKDKYILQLIIDEVFYPAYIKKDNFYTLGIFSTQEEAETEVKRFKEFNNEKE